VCCIGYDKNIAKVCLSLIALMTCAYGAEVRGRAVDGRGGTLPEVSVRLIPSGEGFAKYRAVTDRQGHFDIKDVPAGIYTLRLGQNAFQERVLPALELRPGEVRDAGTIQLELAGCDAPGVICDAFVESKEVHPVVKQGYFILSPGASTSLDTSGTDVTVSLEQGSWRIRAVNGARLLRTEETLPLDGLGPGASFMVQTTRHRTARVIVVDEVRQDSTSIRLWFVTRQ